MENSKVIDQVFSFTQSYRRADALPAPNDFAQYSEGFSIAKIDIESRSEIGISNILIQPYFFRSKVPAQNPVTLAFVMADNLEQALNDGLEKLFDFAEGEFPLTPITDFPDELPAVDQINDYPVRVCYKEIPEIESLEETYPTRCARKLILNENVILRYLVQAGVITSPVVNYFKNTNNKKYLYIIPYVPKIQRTELAISGRISFTLEY